MYISKEKYEAIKQKHVIISDADANRAFEFVWDILIAEVDATKEVAPNATKAIDQLKTSAYDVFHAGSDIEDGIFDEDWDSED